jgi:hypothetical protein
MALSDLPFSGRKSGSAAADHCAAHENSICLTELRGGRFVIGLIEYVKFLELFLRLFFNRHKQAASLRSRNRVSDELRASFKAVSKQFRASSLCPARRWNSPWDAG